MYTFCYIYMTSIQHIINVSTVVCSVQALEGVAADSEERERVSVTAEELQPAERPDVQFL